MAHISFEFSNGCETRCETLIDLLRERSLNYGGKVGYEFLETEKIYH